MEFQERDYQIACASALSKDILTQESDKKTHPVAVVPTAGGKSIILCLVIDNYLSTHPRKDVLVLSHTSDILEQDHAKLETYFDGIEIGLYSAELESRTTGKITVASINSVYRKHHLFANVGLVIVDEFHMVNNKNKGMYRTLLGNLNAIFGGLSASKWRTGQGYVWEGEDSLFNKCSYDLSSMENYNKLIDDGWLCQLIPVNPKYQMDVDGIKTKMGDFDEKQMADRFNREEITKEICSRIVRYGKKYHKWLIFAIDKAHAICISNTLSTHGVNCPAVYSGAEVGKKTRINQLRRGDVRGLVSVNMMTTGLDIPEIDFIAHCRPTKSVTFHEQSNGRGGRVVYCDGMPIATGPQRLAAIAAGPKPHCLVADFAGNTARLGPVNDIKPQAIKGKGAGSGVMAKECNECGGLNHLAAKVCICCGAEFIIKQKITSIVSQQALIKKPGVKLEAWIVVDSVNYSIHSKDGAPSKLQVTYHCGLVSYSQWINPHGKHYARQLASSWVKNRYVGTLSRPKTLEEIWSERDYFKVPSHIFINLDGEYPVIKDCKFEKGDNLPKRRLGKGGNTVKKQAIDFDTFDANIPF